MLSRNYFYLTGSGLCSEDIFPMFIILGFYHYLDENADNMAGNMESPLLLRTENGFTSIGTAQKKKNNSSYYTNIKLKLDAKCCHVLRGIDL